MSAVAESTIRVDKHLMVPMRDGVALATDVYRPDGGEPVPAVLFRLPYDKEAGMVNADVAKLVAAGYAVVAQDTRGRFRSEGTFNPFFDEPADGEDTVAWVAEQPWCDGSVGMAGASYYGATQWMAAYGDTPALKAIAPTITSDDYYEGWSYQGGAFELGFLLTWTAFFLALPDVAIRMAKGQAGPEHLGEAIGSVDGLQELLQRLPLTDIPAFREVAPYYFDWLAHPARDAFWTATAPRERFEEVTVPSLNIGGWYDCFLGGTLKNYTGIRDRGGSDTARRPRLIVGPWAHALMGGEYPERG